ncbi:hypothetical protein CASFOL_031548 [Castilleja foliolosa]|uniref:Uncharacterized protein n=1 Tax=Castilleja foliolosa TaxID=1961234 RepID=A0ABD3C7S4_9LAMI
MASLLLLLSEVLKHESVDNLIMSPPPPSSATVPPPAAAKRSAGGKLLKNLSSRWENYAEAQFQEDLPRICVDLALH